MSLCMIIVAAVETSTPVLPDGSKSHPVAISIVFLLFLFIFFYKPSWGATVWIWTSEVFSMNVRAQAVGMASQTQNVANAIVQQFFPQFLDVSKSTIALQIACHTDIVYRTVDSTHSTCSLASTFCLRRSCTFWL